MSASANFSATEMVVLSLSIASEYLVAFTRPLAMERLRSGMTFLQLSAISAPSAPSTEASSYACSNDFSAPSLSPAAIAAAPELYISVISAKSCALT